MQVEMANGKFLLHRMISQKHSSMPSVAFLQRSRSVPFSLAPVKKPKDLSQKESKFKNE